MNSVSRSGSPVLRAPVTRPRLQRDVILATATQIIRDRGLSGLSLRGLAGRLGVTAPALYAHVGDKDDLLRALAEEHFDRLLARFAAIEADDPLQVVRAQCQAYIDHARAEPALFDLMFVFPPEIASSSVPDGAELAAATQVFAIAHAGVVAAIEAGAIADADPLIVALTLWTSSHGVASALRMGFGLPSEYEEVLVQASIDRLLAGWGAPLPPV